MAAGLTLGGWPRNPCERSSRAARRRCRNRAQRPRAALDALLDPGGVAPRSATRWMPPDYGTAGRRRVLRRAGAVIKRRNRRQRPCRGIAARRRPLVKMIAFRAAETH